MKRMISTKAAETAEGIKDFVKQNGKTTEFGGNVEIGGNLIVNGSAPGGGHAYLITEGTTGITGYFAAYITVSEDYATGAALLQGLYNKGINFRNVPISGYDASTEGSYSMISITGANGAFDLYLGRNKAGSYSADKIGFTKIY